MKSRFLERLDAEMSLATEPYRRACLSLKKASYLARRGDTSESEEIVSELRGQGHYIHNGEVSAWLNFTEGMQLHYAGNDTGAKQKWQRTLAIAQSVGARSLMARSLSWLAFVDYTGISTEYLIKRTREAFKYIGKQDLEAEARWNLTVAQIFHLCGEVQRAGDFYERCRLACLESSDDVMLAALIHNMAWLNMANKRNGILQGKLIQNDRNIVELGAESTRNYEKLIGATSLDAMTPLLGAQVDLIAGRFNDANRAISERLESIGNQGLSRLKAVLLADRAYCLAQMGDADGARCDAERAQNELSGEVHVDDQAVLFSRLSKVYELIGQPSISSECDAKAITLWREYSMFQDNLLEDAEGLSDLFVRLS